VNGEAIYGTRPWKTYGEGPSTTEQQETNRSGGVRDVRSKPNTPEDIRFTTRGKTLYAIVLAWPADRKVVIKSLASNSPQRAGKISSVKLVGSNARLKWSRDDNGLGVQLPEKKPCEIAFALKIEP